MHHVDARVAWGSENETLGSSLHDAATVPEAQRLVSLPQATRAST